MLKLVCSLLLSFGLTNTSPTWLTSAQDAFAKAKTEHKYVLLNFSGSDWCGPCVRMHQEVFESKSFADIANANLVLLNADFPRQKKNRLQPGQEKQNSQLAEKYDPQGSFPYTLLLDADGNILARWDGFPKSGAAPFVAEITAVINKH